MSALSSFAKYMLATLWKRISSSVFSRNRWEFVILGFKLMKKVRRFHYVLSSSCTFLWHSCDSFVIQDLYQEIPMLNWCLNHYQIKVRIITGAFKTGVFMKHRICHSISKSREKLNLENISFSLTTPSWSTGPFFSPKGCFYQIDE